MRTKATAIAILAFGLCFFSGWAYLHFRNQTETGRREPISRVSENFSWAKELKAKKAEKAKALTVFIISKNYQIVEIRCTRDPALVRRCIRILLNLEAKGSVLSRESHSRMVFEFEDGTEVGVLCEVDDWHHVVRGTLWSSSELFEIIETMKH